MSQQNNQPIKKFRINNISAAVFVNEVTKKDKEKHSRFSVQIQKQFQRDDGSWQLTNTFFPEDLPKLRLLTEKSYEFIALQESQDIGEEISV